MPAELMKRSFNGSPPAALSEQIQCACLRVPVEKEQFLWSVFRNLPPDSGVQLVRAWLLHHDLEDISRVERAVTHVHTAKGEHAAALDIMRWAEVRELSVQRSDVERWKSLYFRMLRNTAEERASSTKRSGSLDVAALDMSTPMLEAADCSMQLTEYHSYRTQLTRLDVPLHNITQSEALILRQFLGEPAIDGPLQGDEAPPWAAPAKVMKVPPKEEPELPGPPEVALVGRRVRIYNKDTREYVGGVALGCNGHGKLTIRFDHDTHVGCHLLSTENWDLNEPEGALVRLSVT